MQYPIPNLAAISVGTPIQMVNVQLKVNSAMCVEATTTTLYYASKGDAGKKTSREEALSPANSPTAMDTIPSAPHVGTGTEVIACIAIPGPHLAAPHIALSMVHHLGTPHVPKGALHPKGTTRML